MAKIYELKGNIIKPVKDDIGARRRLKEASAHKKNLEVVLRIVDLAIAGLTHYKIYKSASRLLVTLQEERTLLNLSLVECKKIVDKKGYL